MKKTLFLTAGLCLAMGAQAVVQDSVTFTNVQSLVGGAATTLNHTFTVGSYTLGRINVNGTLEEINGTTNDFLSENKVRITAPGGTTFELSPVGTSYSGAVAIPTMATFAFSNINPLAGAWEFKFRNSFDDSPAGQADAQWNTITIDLTDEAITPPASTNIGTISSTGTDYNTPEASVNHVGGAIKWYRVTTGGACNNLGTGDYFDLDMVGSSLTTCSFGVFTASGDLLASRLGGTTTNPAPAFLGSDRFRLNPNTVAGVVNTVANPSLAAGQTLYIAVAGNTATFASPFVATTTSVDAVGTYVLNVRTDIGDADDAAPSTFTNIGTLADSSSDYEVADHTQTVELPDQQTQYWYKFTLSEDVNASNGNFLDIDTENPDSDTEDTEIALFTPGGVLVATDDDDGDGVESQLTFGEVGPRPIFGFGTAPNGRDGALTAGDYYVVLTTFNSFFATGWRSHNNAPAGAHEGNFVLNFRHNTGAAAGSISGDLVLADWSGSVARSVDFEVFSGMTSVQSSTTTLDLSGGFSIPTTLADGSYNMIINANRGWLKKKIAITVSGGSATTGTTTLLNGDVIDDGVVDLSDYTAVATGFNGLLSDPAQGGDPSPNWNALADINADGVIDLTDYTVVATNFNALDDAP
jgi:hypothetical protein